MYYTLVGQNGNAFNLMGYTSNAMKEARRKLPEDLVHKTPSDGMCGKSDEDNMGFTYDELDDYLLTLRKPKNPEVWEKIQKMHNHPNTKLKLIPMPSPADQWKKELL